MTPSKIPSQSTFGSFLTKNKSYDERLKYIQDCAAIGLDFHSDKPPNFFVPALWFILSTGDEIGEQLFWRCVDDMHIDLKSGGELSADILGAASSYGTYHSFLQEWHRRGLPFSFSGNSNPLGHSISSVRSGISTMEKLVSYGASFLDTHAIFGWDDQTFRSNHSTIVTICPEIPIWALAIQTGNIKSLELMLQTMTSEQMGIAFNNPITTSTSDASCRNIANHISTLLQNKPLSKSQTALVLKPISFSRFATHMPLISAFCSYGVMQYDDVLHTMHLLKNKSLNLNPSQLHAMSCADFNKFYSTLERASLISRFPHKTPLSSVQTAL